MDQNTKKQQIIHAAIEVIKEKSIEEATMREIASKAGLTTGAIYHHYKNKDELFYDIVDQFVHFGHRISKPNELLLKSKEEILSNIKSEVALRFSKLGEQKLHILLLGDVISKDGTIKEKYKADYEDVIKKIADIHHYIYDVEDQELRTMISAIFVATLDGLAIQNTLGVCPDQPEKLLETFNEFFEESIPAFLNKRK